MNPQSELHRGHRQRLRQRIIDQGMDSLEPHEILEYLLGYAIPRQDTNPIAHALIRRFGTLEAVLSADIPELCSVKGIGPGSARWLATLGEIIHSLRRLNPSSRPCCGCMLDLLRYACRLRRRIQPPATLQLCLDARGFVVFCRRIAPSRAWGEADALRRALEDMLGTGAVFSVILQCTDLPHAARDEYDLENARVYAAALDAVNCQLLDVLILSETDIFSFREQKLLSRQASASRTAALRERYEQSIPECPSLLVREILWEDPVSQDYNTADFSPEDCNFEAMIDNGGIDTL